MRNKIKKKIPNQTYKQAPTNDQTKLSKFICLPTLLYKSSENMTIRMARQDRDNEMELTEIAYPPYFE